MHIQIPVAAKLQVSAHPGQGVARVQIPVETVQHMLQTKSPSDSGYPQQDELDRELQ